MLLLFSNIRAAFDLMSEVSFNQVKNRDRIFKALKSTNYFNFGFLEIKNWCSTNDGKKSLAPSLLFVIMRHLFLSTTDSNNNSCTLI